MEELLNDFLADVEEQLKEAPMTTQVCNGMITACNIISSYLMQRYVRNTRLYANKEISYIEYKVTDKMDEEISAIMYKILDICNREVEKNEADMTDKDFKI